jgi:hypothetical protein
MVPSVVFYVHFVAAMVLAQFEIACKDERQATAFPQICQ